MGFPRTHQVFAVELKNHLSGTHRPDDIFVDIGHRIAGDLERERPAPWMSIILAEFLEVIGYLTVNVGQTHLCS